MCGIIGFASGEGAKDVGSRRAFLLEGLAADTFRGWESTGLAGVRLNKENEPAEIYKKAVNGFDFIQLDQTGRMLSDADRFSMMIGHNRAATVATVNDKNAHPFQFGPITLVHNGTINNVNNLNVNPGLVVDSAHVTKSIQEKGEFETLEKLDGGFALVWHNAQDSTLNFARNEAKPLVWAYGEGQNSLFFASEWPMLYWLMHRHNIPIDGKIKVLTPGTWIKFGMKDLREYSKRPFDITPMWKRNQKDWAARGHTNKVIGFPQNNSKGSSTTGATVMTSDELDEIREDVARTRAKEIKNLSGTPTSQKRIKRAGMLLKALGGWDFGKPAKVIPDTWECYKNQLDLGCIVGHLNVTESQSVIIHSVKRAVYEEMKGWGYTWIKMVNTKVIGNKTHIVGVIFEQLVSRTRNDRGSLPKSDDTLHGNEPDRQPTSGRMCWGPGHRLITVHEYRLLVKDGCGNCTGGISTDMDNDLMWARNDMPICQDCSTDPKIREALGLSANDARYGAVLGV